MGGGDSTRYEIGQGAYIKVVLHALKHKTSSVNGVLLGRLVNADDKDAVVEIADSVPLFHSQIGLLPTLEIALIHIEEHYATEGLTVVGYYHANERYDDLELSNVAKKIGDHIFRYFPQPLLLLLDNKKLEALSKKSNRNPVLQMYTRDASKGWRQSAPDASSQLALKEPSANVVLLDYVSTEKWKQIVDFDDHLDDISKCEPVSCLSDGIHCGCSILNPTKTHVIHHTTSLSVSVSLKGLVERGSLRVAFIQPSESFIGGCW